MSLDPAQQLYELQTLDQRILADGVKLEAEREKVHEPPSLRAVASICTGSASATARTAWTRRVSRLAVVGSSVPVLVTAQG